MSTRAIHVRRPGLLTTVQDLGRWGHQATGVPVAGPMDTFSHRLANILTGNALDAATLEITMVGPELQFEGDTTIAVCGAPIEATLSGAELPLDHAVAVESGAILRFGGCRAGARAYLSVAGGIRTPMVLGSRATHLVSVMGGVDGRSLRAGDRLPLAAAPSAVPRHAPGLSLAPRNGSRLRILRGAHAGWFAESAEDALTGGRFRVSNRSNRMGYRLEGPALTYARDDEPISEPLAFGAIQVPAAGEAILLMADRQTAGGYPQIASVIAADLPIAGQLAPGEEFAFVYCSRQEALAALIGRERELLRAADRSPRA